MKKIISFILAIAMIVGVFACTASANSSLQLSTQGSYCLEAGTEFYICAPYDGIYYVDSYENIDPILYVEYENGDVETYDDNISDVNDLEFSASIYLEEGECAYLTVDSYEGKDESISFDITQVIIAETHRDYTIPSGSIVAFPVQHTDSYSVEGTNTGLLYVEMDFYDDYGEFAYSETYNHSAEDGDFFLRGSISEGYVIYAYVEDELNGDDISFHISCSCGIYEDGYFEPGYSYENVPTGTVFEFVAPYSGVFAFESFDNIDPYFEYEYSFGDQDFYFGFDDIDCDAGEYEFYGEIYLEEGQSIYCYVDSWKYEETLNFKITYLGECAHESKSWYEYEEATVYYDGIDVYCCDSCYCIFDYEVIPQLVPETPKAAGANEVGGIKVTWNEVEGVEKYVVYRRAAGSSVWVALKTTTETSFFDSKVQNNKFYVYSIRAYNDAGGYSAYDSAKTYTIKCVATPKLTKIQNATTGIRIDWTKVTGATGYRVYRRGAGSTYWTYLGTTTNLWYVDNAVKNASGNYYRYTVRAVNSYFSGFDTVGLYTKRLSNPVMKSAVSSSKGITVSWSKVNGALSYNVYRKTGSSSWVCIATVKGVNTNSYVDKTAKKGVTYTYTTKAVCGSYMSAYYSTISCKDKY